MRPLKYDEFGAPVMLLLLLLFAAVPLSSGALLQAPDEQSKKTSFTGAFNDYEDEFYVYTPIGNGSGVAANQSSEQIIGHERPSSMGSIGVVGGGCENSRPPSSDGCAKGARSTALPPASVQRNVKSARDNHDEQAAATERRRPYCIGHRESEPTFSWTCRGLQMVRVPSDLKPKPTSLRLSNMGLERVSNAHLAPYKDTIRDFSIEGAPRLTTIEENTFVNMTRLRVVYVFQAPRLISFNFAIVGAHPELTMVRIQQTGLIAWPDLSRFEQTKILSSVDFDNNKIETLGSKPLNIRTELLNLEFNRIQSIGEHTFNGSEIGTLSLFGNRALVYIHHNAFVNLKNLIKLDLSGTSVAQLPPVGWQNLRTLKVGDNYALKQIPPIYAFPQLEEAHLTYAYHCCSFRYPQTHNPAAYEQHRRLQEELNAYCASTRKLKVTTTQVADAEIRPADETLQAQAQSQAQAQAKLQPQITTYTQADSLDDLGQFQATVTLASSLARRQPGGATDASKTTPNTGSKLELDAEGEWHARNSSGALEIAQLNGTQIDCGELVQKVTGLPNISCKPEPDAFNPCEDIMGYPVLRVAVWFVVAASVLGNMSVIVVHLAIFRRLSVPKFLQLNLAIGDLFMGVYLAMLAAADLTTKGTYFNFALDWQHGLGCRLAGASSLFASQLSIFTLSVITFERYYTIIYSIDLNMRLQLGWAARIMLVGWTFAISVAMLPIFANINSYSKTSICLPMRFSYKTDRAFIVILLFVDLLAFLIIFCCYLKMYLLILGQKSEATRKERTVATRMALLVFTDFACWAPIVFFGATAVLGQPLISVTNSKILIVFFYPLNSMANPFLYVLTTRHYRRDLNYVVGRWRQLRANLFKRRKDQLNFNYNNHLHHQPYGQGQHQVGAQLNAQLGALAAATGVAKHLRHYKVPINAIVHRVVGNNCSNEFEIVRSGSSLNGGANLLEPSRQGDSDQQQQQQGKPVARSDNRKLLNRTVVQGQYIIRHTILADKCVVGEERACGSNRTNSRRRVHRALKQRAQLALSKQAAQTAATGETIRNGADRTDCRADHNNNNNNNELDSQSGASKLVHLSCHEKHQQTALTSANEQALVSQNCLLFVDNNRVMQNNGTIGTNSCDRSKTSARHARCCCRCCCACCCCRGATKLRCSSETACSQRCKRPARVVLVQASCCERGSQSDNGPYYGERRKSRVDKTNRRLSSCRPNTASSSQASGEPMSTLVTPTATDKTTEQNSIGQQVAYGIIPKIITTDNGVELSVEQHGGGAQRGCRRRTANSGPPAGLRFSCPRKQSNESLGVCAHRTHHTHKRRRNRPPRPMAESRNTGQTPDLLASQATSNNNESGVETDQRERCRHRDGQTPAPPPPSESHFKQRLPS